MSRIWLVIVIVLGIRPNGLLAAEVAPAKDGQAGHKRLVVRLASVPATDTAGALQQLFRAEGQAAPSAAARSVVIVPEMLSNSLVLAGPPDAVEEVRQLVEQLDHAAVLVRLEVLIAEAPAAEIKPAKPEEKPGTDPVAGQARLLEKPEKLTVLSRATLTTLSDQRALLEISRSDPQFAETSSTSRFATRSVRDEKVGTHLMIVPRVGPDRKVTLRVDVKDSWLGPAEAGTATAAPKEGGPPPMRSIEAFQVQTELTVSDGQTVVLGGAARQPQSGTERLLLLTPHIQPVGGHAEPGR
jgi:type II secretory pathway component GspD/PulD (secretin)